MTKTLLILGVAPMLALGACGGGDRVTSDNTMTTESAMPTDNGAMMDGAMGRAMADNTAMASAATSPAQQFADAVAASDYYEVEAGKLAQSNAQVQGLKDLGGMMVRQHTDSTEKLKAAAGRASEPVVPNPVLNAEQEANLAALRSAEGAAFDTAYKTQQVAAHQKALALLQDYAANGAVPELKAFAADAQKVVQTHLDRIRAM